MKLHEQKLLDVDMPVNHFLRQWKLLTADGKESDAAIRFILCHTAGIMDGERHVIVLYIENYYNGSGSKEIARNAMYLPLR